MTAPVALRMPGFDQLAQHLNVPMGHDFIAAKTLIAMIEAWFRRAMRLRWVVVEGDFERCR